jgi:predicted nuclease with TOPRIM domain
VKYQFLPNFCYSNVSFFSQELIAEIEKKQSDIDSNIDQGNELCEDETIGNDVKKNLQHQLNELEKNWHELKEDALGKQIE